MKKFIYTMVVLAFAVTLNAQWITISPSGTSDIHDISFVDANTGFAAGEGGGKGIILKTTTGGTSWTTVYTTSLNSDWVKSIHFVNVNTGFACSSGGFVYSTTNGGISWSSQSLTDDGLECIRFINQSTGLTCGDNTSNTDRGPTFKTTNGGANWIKVNNSIYHMDFIQYIDASTVYASGDYVIYKSTNGGTSWTDIYPYNHDCNAVCFINENTGFVCGNFTMIKTTNAGENWSDFLLSSSDTNYYSSVYFTDANTGYISMIRISDYAGRIYKTTNTGGNWNLQTNLNGYANTIKFINSNTGFACGGGDKIWKTTNGGVSVQNISTEIPSSYSLGQNYPNPFNPSTKIRFEVMRSPTGTFGTDMVTLVVYDVMGREVQTLVNERLQPGIYETTFNGEGLSSGIYFYRMRAGGYTETKRMMLIR
ncbi:MAG: YCF48-related protein [Ignavibacteria bacterium]